MSVKRRAHHELWCWCAFAQALFDEGVGEDYLGEFDGDVIFVGRPVLSDGRTDTDWRNRDVLPYEFFGTSPLWMQTKQFAVLRNI